MAGESDVALFARHRRTGNVADRAPKVFASSPSITTAETPRRGISMRPMETPRRDSR